MKANELRIGNYYNAFGCDMIIQKEDFANNDAFWSNIKPIPLTEEWLLKCGFEMNVEYPEEYMWQIKTKTGKIVFYSKEFILSSTDTLTKIKHVHQLQNLYFALTGEELTIKN